MVDNIQLLREIGRLLTDKGLTVVTAESCTGGMIATEMTEVPGSSEWFEGAFVTYRLSAKVRMLGVARQALEFHGAVSEPTARAMAEGALVASDGDVSVSVTGVAGPEGGELLAPVGTVWFAWAIKDPTPRCVQTSRHEIEGDRSAVRERAVVIALEGLEQVLDGL